MSVRLSPGSDTLPALRYTITDLSGIDQTNRVRDNIQRHEDSLFCGKVLFSF